MGCKGWNHARDLPGSTKTLSRGQTITVCAAARGGIVNAEVKLLKNMHKRLTAYLAALAVAWTLAGAASAAELTELIPIGRTAGIRLEAQGLLVESIDPVATKVGEVSPAGQAGFQAGDVLQSVDGESLESSAGLQKKVALSGGKSLEFAVKRDGKALTLSAAAVQDKSGVYRLGLTVRDSVAGIGTITYVDPETGQYGSLGHGICDGETGVLVPLRDGNLMESSVSGVIKGVAGTPGSLQGDFNLQNDMGSVQSNTLTGIFGTLTDDSYYSGKQAVDVAQADEIQTGPAVILSNISGEQVKEYACEIEKIYGEGGEYDRSMTIRITDPDLIARTGSPILQNGKLLGAVTHVLVADPTRGYAVQIEKMLEEMEKIH